MTLHIYNLKKENPMKIASVTEKAFDIIQYLFSRSVLSILEIEGNIFDVIKRSTKHLLLSSVVQGNTECLPSSCFRIYLEI